MPSPRDQTDDRGRRATISEVAKAADVSPATVSRVMTGSKQVSPEVAARVLESVKSLGYRPNPAAQRLLRGASHTIGVVVPDLSNPYFAEVLKAVTAAANDRHHRTLVADTNETAAEEAPAADELARWVDGLVLCSPRLDTPALRRLLQRSPPTMLVNRVVRGGAAPAVPSVCVDFASGMRAVCEHLVELGHRRIAYLGGPRGAWSDAQRRRVLRRFGDRLAVHEVTCGATDAAGYAAVDDALRSDPTAIVAFSDYVALGALARLHELGLDVPGDISLVGFDDLPLSDLLRPRLTTVKVVKAHLGRLAVERLLDAGAGAGSGSVPATLVVRDSTAPPRFRN